MKLLILLFSLTLFSQSYDLNNNLIDEYLKYYQSVAKDVITTTTDGRTVQFPAGVLRSFVSHEGIYGTFTLHFNEKGNGSLGAHFRLFYLLHSGFLIIAYRFAWSL